MHANMMDIGYEKRMDTHDQIWKDKNDKGMTIFEDVRKLKRDHFDSEGAANCGMTNYDIIKANHRKEDHPLKRLKPKNPNSHTSPDLREAVRAAVGPKQDPSKVLD